MNLWVGRKLAALTLAAASLASIGCAGGYVSGYAASAPPPVRFEERGRAPGAGYVWINGYWGYRGNNYAWIPGRWDRPPRGRRRWEDGRWEHRGNSYRWREGRWR